MRHFDSPNPSPEELLKQRKAALVSQRGWESPESLRLLKESGAPMHEVYRKVYGYGEKRWQMLRQAGYSLEELVDYMQKGWWLDNYNEIGDPYLNIIGPWTSLFFYCGFEIDELRTVGFRAEISPEKEAELKEKRRQFLSI